MAADIINRASDGAIKAVVGQDFLGTVGETLVLRNLSGVRALRVVLVGLGKQADFNVKNFAKAQQAATRQCISLRVADACSTLLLIACPDSDTRQRARLSAQACWQAAYFYDATFGKPDPARKPKLRKVTVLCDKSEDKAAALGLSEGDALGQGMSLTRTLGNLPSNICTPTFLGNQARTLGRQFKSLKVSVLEKNRSKHWVWVHFYRWPKAALRRPDLLSCTTKAVAQTRPNPHQNQKLDLPMVRLFWWAKALPLTQAVFLSSRQRPWTK